MKLYHIKLTENKKKSTEIVFNDTVLFGDDGYDEENLRNWMKYIRPNIRFDVIEYEYMREYSHTE